MKSVEVTFADGRRIPVRLRYECSLQEARRLCQRRFRLERVIDVRPDPEALEAAHRQAISTIRAQLDHS